MIKRLDDNVGVHTIIDKINEMIDFLNDTYLMDVADGNFVSCGGDIESPIFVTGLSTDDCCIDNMVHGAPIKGNAKCPHCGTSYYTEMFSTSTAVYYPPVYKDGVNINPDMNQSTTHCRCLNCGKEFDI